MEKVNRVRDIKKIIDDIILPGYSYHTNFNSSEFLIDINYRLVIAAKLVKNGDEMEYKFILDTQFLSEPEITYDEIKMISNIIDILEYNKKFVLSRLKKYTVEEYEKEMAQKKKDSDAAMTVLMNMITNYKAHVIK